MNSPERPLSAHDLDELLSADIDGELAAAAVVFGLSLEAARDAIATPAARDRRAALVGAARLVAAPVELPAGTADRIVTDALATARADNELDAARRRRERRADAARRVLVVAGSAAAVVVVILGLTHLGGGASNSNSKASSAVPSESSAKAPPKAGETFGAVAGPEQLRRRLQARLGLPKSQRSVSTQPTGLTLAPGTYAPGATSNAAESLGTDDAVQKIATCASPARKSAAASGAPVLHGAVQWQGRPAYVYVFRRGDGYEAVVVRRSDCSEITSVAVP